MPLHPQAQALLEVFESFGDPPIETSTPEAVRALRMSRLRPPTVSVHEIRDVDAGGVPARLYRPSADRDLGLLVLFHGGGWVVGNLETHDNLARALAAESGQAVLSVDYRLAPEHPFPAGLEDAFTATAWACENAGALGCDPGRVAIGGDSAGANLAAVVTQAGTLPLRFQLLVYPVTDVRGGSPSYEAYGDGPWLHLDDGRRAVGRAAAAVRQPSRLRASQAERLRSGILWASRSYPQAPSAAAPRRATSRVKTSASVAISSSSSASKNCSSTNAKTAS